ncbi:hypothetical protein FE810_02815 [Thalassotalea litorea]|uniref:PEP-CTERM sorting domain-containing protein n=1 Tax=Thalassotalea litorea TaxID=2020715 RepID=A0A5R9IV47_9GAMM|nr:hypothetical protein [Thalassotalea litorea]TLU67231.1 hypothetical protein FE810_02815 [Thalassotalea litorea]
MKLITTFTCVFLLFTSSLSANAAQINGFVDYYDENNWEVETYIDDYLDVYEDYSGFSNPPSVGINSEQIGLTGGSSVVGSLVGGGDSFARIEIIIPMNGTISFDWNYYVSGDELEIRLEPFGYLLNGTFFHLAADPDINYDYQQYYDYLEGQEGSVTITVEAGDKFGFTVFSDLTFLSRPDVNIFNFSAPAPESVPESNTLILALVSVSLLLTRKPGQSKYMKV